MQLWKKCNELMKSRDEVEKIVWHGSSYDILNKIIRNGFDRSYSTIAAYGKGTYFARDASYSCSSRYSPPHSDGYKYLLLCKFIVGDSSQGLKKMHKVPLKPNGNEYDTLVDYPQNPSIYVVWTDFAAVPMYRIKFK